MRKGSALIIVIVVVGVLLVGGVLFYVLNHKNQTQAPQSQSSTTTNSSQSSSTTDNNTQPSGNAVTIADMAFSPSSLTVKKGTTVTWTNKDNVVHTVTANDHSFESGNLASGKSFSHAFNAAGTFSYKCTLHPSMTGTITVTE